MGLSELRRTWKTGMVKVPEIDVRRLLEDFSSTKILYLQIGKVADVDMLLFRIDIRRIHA